MESQSAVILKPEIEAAANTMTKLHPNMSLDTDIVRLLEGAEISAGKMALFLVANQNNLTTSQVEDFSCVFCEVCWQVFIPDATEWSYFLLWQRYGSVFIGGSRL